MGPTERNGFVTAMVESPGAGAWFIARDDDGRAYEVHGVAPGDRVLLRPDSAPSSRAEVVELLSAGPCRRTPACPLAGQCGGCHWQQIDEAAQRRLRRRQVENALVNAGVGLAGVRIFAPEGASPLGGRFRVRFQADFTRGRRLIGYHRLGSRDSLDAPSCPMLAPELERVHHTLRTFFAAGGEEDLTGFEVTALPGPDGALVLLNPRDRPPRGWAGLARRLLDLEGGGVAGVAVARPGAAGGREVIGRGHILGSTPAGYPVAAAAGGFVQSQLAAADQLADTVASAASASAGARILELFSGAGLLGWRMAAAGAEVEAVESDLWSVRAAQALPRPGPGAFAPRLGDARGSLTGARAFDTIVADPPRDGLGATAENIGRLDAPLVVLVSCDAQALARDAAALGSLGYGLVELTLVDLFPGTRWTETVASFARRRSCDL